MFQTNTYKLHPHSFIHTLSSTHIMTFQNQSTSFTAFTTTLFIHQDHIGFILGSKCCTINGLALHTHTRITGWNEDKEYNFRKFVICGRSIQDISQAYNELCHLANIVNQQTPRAHTLPPQMFFPTQHQGIETRLVVQPHNVGILLGTKGTTIHTITKTTGTWAKFYQNDTRNNNQPTFSIRAFYQKDIQNALRKMNDIIQASSPPPLTIGDVANITHPIPRSNAQEPYSPPPPTHIKKVSFKIISKNT